ncbi:proline--tRNA ligase [Candidatus Magnetominusculus dajiuhuensis]|uniref:proline--tRNA ligase n=1 Tax=Candidatus Magnetominusculus dajiuhuensis TaxID=3137712 RepID=UPI003B42A49D
MRYSKLLIPTLKETPSEAEAISHILMIRGGYIRQLAAGLYISLPLFVRVMEKINTIIRQEMSRIGAQELSMPVLHPAEVWQKTGRWDAIGDEMFRLKDRTDRDMCLAMTHEEIMTWLAAKELRSYRDLPQMWYQIQTKLRDEARPKSGILRTREFIMKDSYSFDADEAGLNESYKLHAAAYHRIFARCGLLFYQVESDPGMMGGTTAHEFMAPSDAGEDEIALCGRCGYAANVELAVSVPPEHPTVDMPFEEVYTPDKKSVNEVSEFLKLPPHSFIKSLLLIAKDGEKNIPVLALLRGDEELHELKTQRAIGRQYRPAHKEEIVEILGVEAGFIGPVNMINKEIRVIASTTLKKGLYVSGANKKDYHIKGINPDVHFQAEWHDIRVIKEDERCVICGAPLKIRKVIEIGNIFKLGTKYSVPLNAVYLNKDGIEVPIIMGSYGIGPARVAAAAIEQNNDENGIIWPVSIAPFTVLILPLNISDEETVKTADLICAALKSKGIDFLIDDRDTRPGIKFKDADLTGIPYQIIIGAKNLKDGLVEIKNRRTKETVKVPPDNAAENISRLTAVM